MTGAEAAGNKYHVHVFPTDAAGGADAECGGGITGGHFNPTFTNGSVTKEVGDLSGKHGLLTPSNSTGVYADASLPLTGDMSIVGRSIVIHKNDGSRWVCANIGTAGIGKKITFPTKAGYPSGSIELFQATPASKTTVTVSMTGAEVAGNKYHVHVNPTATGSGADAECGGGITGGHFNPTFTNGSVTKEVGDLSGKHGLLTPSNSKAFYTDATLPLSGDTSVLGRSIVIHKNDASRWVCADVGGTRKSLVAVAPTDLNTTCATASVECTAACAAAAPCAATPEANCVGYAPCAVLQAPTTPTAPTAPTAAPADLATTCTTASAACMAACAPAITCTDPAVAAQFASICSGYLACAVLQGGGTPTTPTTPTNTAASGLSGTHVFTAEETLEGASLFSMKFGAVQVLSSACIAAEMQKLGSKLSAAASALNPTQDDMDKLAAASKSGACEYRVFFMPVSAMLTVFETNEANKDVKISFVATMTIGGYTPCTVTATVKVHFCRTIEKLTGVTPGSCQVTGVRNGDGTAPAACPGARRALAAAGIEEAHELTARPKRKARRLAGSGVQIEYKLTLLKAKDVARAQLVYEELKEFEEVGRKKETRDTCERKRPDMRMSVRDIVLVWCTCVVYLCVVF